MKNERLHRAWLFQANPKTFDLDAFLASGPAEFLWLVRRLGDQMHVGDTVYLWRAVAGDPKESSGIVAEAEIIEAVQERSEDAFSIPFWREGDPSKPEPRARLRLIRAANKREVLQRDWLLEDPVLRDLTILKAAIGTNFALSHDESARIAALWSRTGRSWTYAEAVAGLWAYHQTYDGEVSRKPGAPVSTVALLIGRAVSGVYNKVMNFRHLDPRDERAGLSGAGESDRQAWARFSDPETGQFRPEELESEFRRLWQAISEPPPIPEDDADTALEDDAARLVRLSLEELLARYGAKHPEQRAARPRAKVTSSRRFARDPLVVAIGRVRAKFRCEVPDCSHPTFVAVDGRPFTEVHHIEPLEEGGPDTPGNVACVCPAHHREAHFGKQAEGIRLALKSLRAGAEIGSQRPLLAPEPA